MDALIANEGLSPSLQQSLQQWNNDLNQQQLTPQQQQPGAASGTQAGTTATATDTPTSSSSSSSRAPALAGRRSSSIGGDKGLLQTPVIGRVTLKRVLLALRLDERRVGELLAGGMQVSSWQVSARVHGRGRAGRVQPWVRATYPAVGPGDGCVCLWLDG